MVQYNNKIKNKLLKIYEEDNPSEPTNLKKILKINTDIIENKLKFPGRFFNNMSVGDFACGTGEFSMVAAKNGAKVEGYDFNKISIDIAKKNSKKLKINNIKFFTKEFFNVKKKYDFVFFTAALHHLPNPYAGIKHLINMVKENGFLFLSFGSSSSNLQHNLMKLIVRNWGKSKKEITVAANLLFNEHINRCVKYGHRSRESVIADQYINTQHYYLDLKKFFGILEKKFVLHSSWPPIYLPRGDSGMNSSIENLSKYIFPSELIWSTKTIDDDKRLNKQIKNNRYNNLINLFNHKTDLNLNDLISKKKIDHFYMGDTDLSFGLNEHNKKFFVELKNLISFFKKEPSLKMAHKYLNKSKYLFKGTLGVGLNYFIFKKKF